MTTQLPFGAHLAGHAGNFRGEGPELVHHRVDGVFQLQNLAANVYRDFSAQIAISHGGGDVGDVSHLTGEVRRHRIDAVGQIFPRAGYAENHSLAAELAFGAHLAGHAGNFRGEGAELVHHRVDGVFELEDLASDVHGDLLRQIAVGDSGSHVGDVSHLGSQVSGHRVDTVGEVPPGPGQALHHSLAAELAFGAHLAGHASDLRREGAKLFHHAVDDFSGLQKLAFQRPAFDFHRHRLRQIALGDRADHSGHLVRRLNQIAD